jgi:aminoglycoside phosphotransferase (APT) family kinase protein
MTSAVVSASSLDLDRVGAYLQSHVEGFSGLRKAERLLGGQSNPIWLLTADSGRYVMRTQPAGQLLKSAHALDREFRILSTLEGTGVPVPRARLICDDLDVIGVQFYLMDYIDGEVHRNITLPNVPRDRRAAVYEAALGVLVAIHRTDLDRLKLRDFGRSGNYFERQLHRWSRQYRTAMPDGLPEMEGLILRLQGSMPREEGPVVLLHGDCRLDNLMFERGTDRVVAVLDWELSTLGHPLADLGQFLGVQELAPDYLLPGLAGVDRAALGIPSQREMASNYLRKMSLPQDIDLRFYKGFAMFRQAAMSAGLLRRALDGTAVAEISLSFGRTTDVMARIGLEILDSPEPD